MNGLPSFIPGDPLISTHIHQLRGKDMSIMELTLLRQSGVLGQDL